MSISTLLCVMILTSQCAQTTETSLPQPPCCENATGKFREVQKILEPVLPKVLFTIIKSYADDSPQFIALIDDIDHSAQLHTERIHLSSTFKIFTPTVHDTLTLLQIEVYRQPTDYTTPLDAVNLGTESSIINAIQHKYYHIPLYGYLQKPKSFNTHTKVSFNVLEYLDYLIKRKAEIMAIDAPSYRQGTYRSLLLLAPGLSIQKFGAYCSNTYAELLALHQSPQFPLLSRYKQSCTPEYLARYEESGKEKFELLKTTKHGETGVLFSRPMSLEQRRNWETTKWLFF